MASEKLTITLTNAAPVTIIKDNWPIVARSSDHDNQYECQANRRWWMAVRQHKDGRTIVYGAYDTCYQDEHSLRGGRFLDDSPTTEDIIHAIHEVGEYLEFSSVLIDECIADLPAVELD